MSDTAQCRGGDPAEEGLDSSAGPMRRCLVTGQRRPVPGLIRFVVGPDDRLVPDLARRLPGRGIWLSASRDVVNTAGDKGLFARAAKKKVVVPDGLADELEGQLVRRCVDALGLARRAGQAVAGFEKTAQWLKGRQAGLLVTAADAGADGRAKLARLGASGSTAVSPFTVLFGTELGRAFGRDQVVHAAVAPGSLADRLMAEQERLQGFREETRPEGQDASQQH